MVLDRYNRQTIFPGIGPAGQERIARATAVVAGCGALGTVIANTLARAGVGNLRIIDRDFVEESNLHRQVLFDEQDCRENLPKAVAAVRKLKQINSTIAIAGIVTDITPKTVERFVEGADVVVDGTDNFETRYLLNDACVKHNIPWVYGGAVASTGMTMTIVPGQTPCLRCVFAEMPPPGTAPTCDTAGVLGALPGVIGSIQANEALKICAGKRDAVNARLLTIDLWTGDIQKLNIGAAREQGDCPCCQRRQFEFLEGRAASSTVAMCGRTVQISPSTSGAIDLRSLAKRLAATSGVADVRANVYLLRFTASGSAPGKTLDITVFTDGRAILKGTQDAAEARTAYAKYVGA
jgi:adenylyltransferase/sulfurtransferase